MPVAIVTGASSGIGLAIAQALAGRGWALVVNSRRITPEHPAIQHINARELAVVPGDAGKSAVAGRIFDTALERFGQVDLLVNNAGVFIPRPFTEYTAADLDTLLTTNVRSFFHLTRLALAHMAGRRSGHVVNVTTSLAENAQRAVPSVLPILTKGGLNAATRALALEFADRGVRVNAVSPGIIRTPMHREENHAFLATLQPLGRLGAPEEVARGVLYLVDNAFVTGEILHVDGGAYTGHW